jgi:hypothetical protein
LCAQISWLSLAGMVAGKARGFALPADAAATQARAAGEAQPQPAELGARVQLEAALCAAAVHLLALLPACASPPAPAQHSVGAAQLACLRRLVRQAGLEGQAAAQPAGQWPPEEHEAVDEEVWDVSRVAPREAAAAEQGLALLAPADG